MAKGKGKDGKGSTQHKPWSTQHKQAKANATSDTGADSKQRYQKIPGTKIHYQKGGVAVRVVVASGKEFQPNDIQGVQGHIDKIGSGGATRNDGWGKAGNGRNRGSQKGGVSKGKGTGKGGKWVWQPEDGGQRHLGKLGMRVAKTVLKKKARKQLAPEKLEELRAKRAERNFQPSKR